MLSPVLRSDKSIDENIAIMRTFIQLRKNALMNKKLVYRLEELETGFESLRWIFTKVLIQETKPIIKMGFILDEKDNFS